jgi:hypothetical protein
MVKEALAMNSYDLFEDRVKSLLERWHNFKENHPGLTDVDKHCIKGFLSEVNDAFTQSMLREE